MPGYTIYIGIFSALIWLRIQLSYPCLYLCVSEMHAYRKRPQGKYYMIFLGGKKSCFKGNYYKNKYKTTPSMTAKHILGVHMARTV